MRRQSWKLCLKWEISCSSQYWEMLPTPCNKSQPSKFLFPIHFVQLREPDVYLSIDRTFNPQPNSSFPHETQQKTTQIIQKRLDFLNEWQGVNLIIWNIPSYLIRSPHWLHGLDFQWWCLFTLTGVMKILFWHYYYCTFKAFLHFYFDSFLLNCYILLLNVKLSVNKNIHILVSFVLLHSDLHLSSSRLDSVILSILLLFFSSWVTSLVDVTQPWPLTSAIQHRLQSSDQQQLPLITGYVTEVVSPAPCPSEPLGYSHPAQIQHFHQSLCPQTDLIHFLFSAHY